MSVKLVVQLGMFALAVTVASLTVLGPLSSNSSPKSIRSIKTLLDPTDETLISEELGLESGTIDSLSPVSSFLYPSLSECSSRLYSALVLFSAFII